MNIMQIVALGIVAAILVLVIRQEKPELALQVSLLAGLGILAVVVWKMLDVVQVLERLAVRAELNMVFLGTLLRIVGISYLAEFASQVCRDAGEGAIAGKVELAGKVAVLLLAVPIISTILETVTRLLP